MAGLPSLLIREGSYVRHTWNKLGHNFKNIVPSIWQSLNNYGQVYSMYDVRPYVTDIYFVNLGLSYRFKLSNFPLAVWYPKESEESQKVSISNFKHNDFLFINFGMFSIDFKLGIINDS